MPDEQLLEEISKKLSALIALRFLPDAHKTTLGERVALLVKFGIPNQEVADILGTTKGTVEVLKSRASKKGK